MYPEPLGSRLGFKKTSILDLACGGNTKKYNNGTVTITANNAIIIYFLLIPDTKSIRTVAIKNAIAGVNELTSQVDTIDGNKFNANIESIMPGIERLQSLPEGDGLNKKAKEIKTAITTLFNIKMNKNADDMINKVDRLTDALERFSKIDSSSIAKTLGIEGSLNFRETSSSTLGTETKRNTPTTNINVDNSNLEAMLERILNAIESLKEGKTWTDQEASTLR